MLDNLDSINEFDRNY